MKNFPLLLLLWLAHRDESRLDGVCEKRRKNSPTLARVAQTRKNRAAANKKKEKGGKRKKRMKMLFVLLLLAKRDSDKRAKEMRDISKFSYMLFSTTFPRCSDDMMVQHSPTTENLSPSFLSSCVIVVAEVDVQQTIFTRLAAPARWMHYSNHPNCMSGMAINAVKSHPLKSKILNWIFSLLFRVFFTCCRLVRPTMTLLNCIE